jgi:hypothetical protein
LKKLIPTYWADQKIYQGTLMSEEWKLWPMQKQKQGKPLPSFNKKTQNNDKKFENVISIRRDN